jgi:hypothetical protein
MYSIPMSGKGSVLSMEILSKGFRVDSTNREAGMDLCLAFIFWHVGQLCTNYLTSCSKFCQFAPSVSRGACSIISAMVVLPLSVRESTCGTFQLGYAVPSGGVH